MSANAPDSQYLGSPTPDPAAYQFDAMIQALQGIAEPAKQVRIRWDKLDAVVERMRGSIASNWFIHFWARHDALPEEAPLVNDRDTIQFFYVLGGNDYHMWFRNNDGHVVPFRITINRHVYEGIRGVLACHMRALRRGIDIHNPEVLVALTRSDLEEFYRDESDGQVRLNLLDWRLEGFHEIGRVLMDRYDGHFANLLERSEGYLFRPDGQGIIQELSAYFPHCYGDWPFCKLPIVTTRGLVERLETPFQTTDEYRRLSTIKDPEHFLLGADYYRPLFFFRVGLLEAAEELAAHLRDWRLIDRDSDMEREYRAATMLLGIEMTRRLGTSAIVPERETWAVAFMKCRHCRVGISDEELPCPYKPVCRAYSEDPEIMRLGWPLVLTHKY